MRKNILRSGLNNIEVLPDKDNVEYVIKDGKFVVDHP